jgi:hypothetical protein
MRTNKLDAYTRKSADIMLAYVRGELSALKYRAKLRALDASEPYIVTEETWRRYDGSRFKVVKILERASSKIISTRTEPVTPEYKVVRNVADLAHGQKMVTDVIINAHTGKPIGMRAKVVKE